MLWHLHCRGGQYRHAVGPNKPLPAQVAFLWHFVKTRRKSNENICPGVCVLNGHSVEIILDFKHVDD